MPLNTNEYDLLMEMKGDIGEIKGAMNGINAQIDSYTDQKQICDKKFGVLEAHRNKVLGAIAITVFLSSVATAKSFGLF